jgi:hypothetical protein
MFTALHGMWQITKNNSGQLSCDVPADPKMAAMERDFEDGWAVISCSTPSTPQVSGIGSFILNEENDKHPKYWYDAHYKKCEEKYGMDMEFSGRDFFF